MSYFNDCCCHGDKMVLGSWPAAGFLFPRWWNGFDSVKYSFFYSGGKATRLAKQGRDKIQAAAFLIWQARVPQQHKSSFPSFTRRSPEEEDILNHLQPSPEDLLGNIMLNRTQLSAGLEGCSCMVLAFHLIMGGFFFPPPQTMGWWSCYRWTAEYILRCCKRSCLAGGFQETELQGWMPEAPSGMPAGSLVQNTRSTVCPLNCYRLVVKAGLTALSKDKWVCFKFKVLSEV